MTLVQLLQEQERMRNRLFDPDMEDLYLALTREVNKMATDAPVIDLEEFFEGEVVTNVLNRPV